jgi:hypothetical protein
MSELKLEMSESNYYVGVGTVDVGVEVVNVAVELLMSESEF